MAEPEREEASTRDQPASERGGGSSRPAITTPAQELEDQIQYMADLILELKQLADYRKLTTLSGILSLAHVEAKQQAKLHKC